MRTKNFGLYVVMLTILGMGGWVVHDALDDPGQSPLAAAEPAGAPSTMQFRVAPGAQDPINVALAPPGRDEQDPITLALVPPRTDQAPGQLKQADGASVPPLTLASHSSRATADAAPARLVKLSVIEPSGKSAAAPRAGKPPASAGQTRQPAVVKVRVVTPGQDNRQRRGDDRDQQVLATNGAIVYLGDDGALTANTGPTTSSGVVALGVDDSNLQSGTSTQPAQSSRSEDPASSGQVTDASDAQQSHANDSFQALLPKGGADRNVAISGFEDHSVSVIGADQIVTYDDSNVFIDRDGQINANTGDTDSSGLNAVDVVGSVVESGNSGDAEGNDDEEEEDEDEVEQPGPGSELQPAPSSSGDGEDADDEDGTLGSGLRPGDSFSTVTDEGASTATGPGGFVVGADGFDDVSVRSRGNRNIVTYDDSNVVIGGTGKVNAQIGDSDTGGAVVMGIRNSKVKAGNEGDLWAPVKPGAR
jgi:hypothetical protein